MSISTHHAAHRFDRCAPQYQRFATVQQRVAERLMAFSEVSDRYPSVVLDLGSGTGEMRRLFEQRPEPLAKQSIHFIELDISMSMLQVSRGRVVNLLPHSLPHSGVFSHQLRADMAHLPLAPQSVHRLYSSMALQWSSSTQHVCQEMAQVLTAQGEAFLAIPVAPSLESLAALFASCDIESERIYSFSTASVWLQSIADAGLRVEQTVLESFSFIPSQPWYTNGWRSALKSLSGIGASAPMKPLSRVQYQRLKARLMAHNEPHQLFRFELLFLRASRP